MCTVLIKYCTKCPGKNMKTVKGSYTVCIEVQSFWVCWVIFPPGIDYQNHLASPSHLRWLVSHRLLPKVVGICSSYRRYLSHVKYCRSLTWHPPAQEWGCLLVLLYLLVLCECLTPWRSEISLKVHVLRQLLLEWGEGSRAAYCFYWSMD